MKWYKTIGIAVILILSAGFMQLHSAVNAQTPSIYKSLVNNTSEWQIENSGTVEKVTRVADGWLCEAGGVTATTHYARVKYKIPEKMGTVITKFHLKATIILPSDFYSKQQAGFRIMNTDNFGTTLNGVHVGASGTEEFRTGVYINSDHTMRVNLLHDNHPSIELYRGGQLPVGQHVLELFGDVANAGPWWFKIDGATVASGNARLSADTVPVGERVITRLVAGIDGAASQSNNPMAVLVKNVELANYNMSSGTGSVLTPIPTMTQIPTATPTVTKTPTPSITKTPTPTPPPALSCPPAGYTAKGKATMTVQIPQSGNYKLWVDMMGRGDSANSLFLQIDGLFCINVGDLAGMPANEWTWIDYQNGNSSTKIAAPLLAAGSHTITLVGNAAEPGVKVDRILLTKDTSCVPVGNGDKCIGVVSTPTRTPTPTYAPSITTISVPSATPIIGNAPVFNVTSLPEARLGESYSVTVIATDATPSDSVRIKATHLPNGIRLLECTRSGSGFGGAKMTCVLKGVATKTGTFQVKLIATDIAHHETSIVVPIRVMK